MKRIICVGNSLLADDACGTRVYDLLLKAQIPAGVELIDGGLAGLDLLNLLEDAQRVVFVDRISGFTVENQLLVLNREEVAAEADTYGDHSSGLSYLLRVLPHVSNAPLPEIAIIGIEGRGSDELLHRAAALALQLICADASPTGGCNEVDA